MSVFTPYVVNASPYASRGLGLFPVHFPEKLLEPHFQCLVLTALVEFADKVSAGPQGVVREAERGRAKILKYVSIGLDLLLIPAAADQTVRNLPYYQHGLGMPFRWCS